jgi:predicted tellurium resistance membrane protein TerC
METLFSVENWFTLAMLILLELVLGFDNILYISLESKKVALEHRSLVRRIGLTLAIVLRIALLFILLQAIELFKEPFFTFDFPGVIEGSVNVHAVIVLLGGAFILYTAIQEIFHMMSIDHDHEGEAVARRSLPMALFWIISMNLVFSFDSVLSAIALTHVFWVMATGITIAGLAMIFLIDHVADFLDRNRMYEVLGLFILLLVGILLVSEGGHLSHLALFGQEVIPMAKSTFYFVLFVMVAVDIVQGRYQRKLMAERSRIKALAQKGAQAESAARAVVEGQAGS